VAEPVRRQLIEGTAGNPLALLELPDVLTAAQLAGQEPLPHPMPVGTSIERVFAGRAAGLPEPSRRLLVLAAAEDTGRLDVIGRAAAGLGLDLVALGPAEAAGLVRVSRGRVEFRHPLVRSAVYQHAEFAVRQTAHLGLAAVLDDVADLDRVAEVLGDLDDRGARDAAQADLLRAQVDKTTASQVDVNAATAALDSLFGCP